MRTARFVLSVISSIVIVLASGCGGAAVRDRASIPRHQWSDGDWYSQAIDDAVRAYEAEVAALAAHPYASAAEADAIATTFGGARFERHLEASLARYGLTLGGLDLYASRHPELVVREEALHAMRIARAAEQLDAIASRLAPSAVLVAFDEPEQAPSADRVASR